jgi:hypothetical protein
VSSLPGRGRAWSRGACVSEPYPAGPVHGCFAGFQVRRGGSRAQERGQRGRPGADSPAGRTRPGRLEHALSAVAPGRPAAPARAARGRPGHGSASVLTPATVEIAAALARHAGQGRDLRVAIVAWFFEAGRPVALDEPLSRSRRKRRSLGRWRGRCAPIPAIACCSAPARRSPRPSRTRTRLHWPAGTRAVRREWTFGHACGAAQRPGYPLGR